MRPVIGITANFGMNSEEPARLRSYLLAGYSDGVYAAGGIAQPIPAPPDHDDGLLDEILDCYDGLIFTGGYDLNPRRYGQSPHARTHLLHPRRERFELDLFRRADARRIPMLGICLGHQLAHVARGGALIQHVDDLALSPRVAHHLPKDENAFHSVTIHAGSRLAEQVGVERLEVNSRHHQVVDPKRLGAGLATVAVADDGVVEASEDCEGRFLATVQWHPEDLLDRREHAGLFKGLVEQAKTARVRAH